VTINDRGATRRILDAIKRRIEGEVLPSVVSQLQAQIAAASGGGGGGGGSVATDAIWDAAGDMVQGSGVNTAVRTPLGTAGQVWTVNTGATAAEWAAPPRVKLGEFDLVSATNDVTFSSIPSGYDALELRWLARTNGNADGGQLVCLQLNADTGSNYDYLRLAGLNTGVTATESRATTFIFIGVLPDTAATTDAAAQGIATIEHYAETTFQKIVSAVCDWKFNTSAGGIRHEQASGHRRNTAAITSMRVFPGAGQFMAGSKFTLWGIR
jgi:hypothetical protein